MSRDAINEARLAGINAYHDLLELDANPYTPKTNKHRAWAEGWNYAKKAETNPVYWGDIAN